MATYRFSSFVRAEPDRVFSAWMDLDRMAEWVGGVTRVTDLTGPVDVAGTTYTVWFGRMRSPTRIVEVTRPSHVRTRFGNLILKGETDVRFEPEDGGTRITQVFETRGVVSAVAARVFATGSYEGSFRGELESFRRMVEGEAGG